MKKYNLLVPMAGLGSRFKKEGYEVPKQFIYVRDKQLIDISLDCIDMSECNLIFVVRDEQIYNYSADKVLKNKYGEDIKIVVTDGLTRGSVCSCLLAKEHIDNDLPLIIHTLDIQFFPKLDPKTLIDQGVDGSLLTFKSNSSNYSYVKLNDDNMVIETAEKKVISDKACVGIYYFSKGSTFCNYAQDMIDKELTTKGEFYISPLYNLLIESGLKINNIDVDKIHIFGTPKEFVFYKENVIKKIGDKPIALCADHSGYECKEKFKKVLDNNNIQYIDFGTHIDEDCDYRYYINQAINSKRDGVCDFVFGFCRTGQGVNICANTFSDIRGALIFDQYTAEMSIRHNCANFFSFPARLLTEEEEINSIINILSSHTFDGGRHQIRIQELKNETV
mgnify:CR=1 FL=1